MPSRSDLSHHRGLGPVVAFAIGTLVGGALPAVGQSRASGDEIPIDRWLVSDRLEVSAGRLDSTADPLAGRGGVAFPDRDLEVGPSYWTLVREDGVRGLNSRTVLSVLNRREAADEAGGEAGREVVEGGDDSYILAHVYLKAPEDRSVLLDLRAEDCQSARAWLNGQPIQILEAPAYVRLAGGWNTLLVRLHEDSRCSPGLTAAVLARGDVDAEAEQDPGLTGIRIQASRPPGVRRAHPEGWVGLGDIHPGPSLSWRTGAEDLVGTIAYEYMAWGRSTGNGGAQADDRGRGEDPEETPTAEPGEGEEGEGEPGTDPQRPDRPGPPGRPRREGPGFGAVSDIAAGQVSDEELRARMRAQLLPPTEPTAPAPETVAFEVRVAGERLSSTVVDVPMGVVREGSNQLPFKKLRDGILSNNGVRIRVRWADEEREVRRILPAEPLLTALHGAIALTGWTDQGDGTFTGTWRVPEALAGFSLRLVPPLADQLTLNGSPLIYAQPNVCSPCRKGERLQFLLTAPEPAEGIRVQIVERGYPAATVEAGSPPAADWLRALRGDNRDYRELAARFASGG